MAIADLGSLGEFISSLAVLITLLFLTLQARPGSAKLHNDRERSASTTQAGLGLMGPNAFEAYTKALRRPSDLTEEEAMQVWAFLDVALASASSTWSAYRRGLATHTDWLDAKAGLHYALSFPVGVVIWNQMKRCYSREMTAEIDEYLLEHGADRVLRRFTQMLDEVRRLPAAQA